MGVNRQPKKGSSVQTDLPRDHEEAPDEPRVTAAPTVPVGRETVLFVQDEDEIRHLATDILTQQGYTVLEAKDGPDALRLCQRHAGPIDLLVTDVVMPRMSGLRLADRLRAQRPHIKTLFVSGYLDDVRGERDASAGDITLLPKPFGVATLIQKVRDVLDRP